MNESASNQAAMAHWNREAVGAQRTEAPKGSREYFEQIRAYRYGYETPFIPRLFRFSELGDKKVLEIGVGNGIDALEMMRHGAIYTGLDITNNHLELTRQHYELQRQHLTCPAPVLLRGDLTQIELPERYDRVYSFGVLHHISHEEAYLKRLHDALKDDGILMVAVYSKYSFFNAYMAATWLLRNRKRVPLAHWQSHLAERTRLDAPVEIKIRSRREVQDLLQRCGFHVMSYRKRGFVQKYVPLVGRFLRPDGATLNLLGSLLGWYHLFFCGKSAKSADERRD
jgi:2-polyprenyl-3-methyl-5-hydroxy-6-metoxy-1,4-benzoquinol methylase